MNAEQEKILRENIRQLIEIVKQKKINKEQKIVNEEKKLREIIQTLIDYELKKLSEASTPDNEPTPNKSTGINVLEDLLKKIIPVLQIDFKLLTTDPSQRESFRAHIINAVIDSLTPAEANNAAGELAAAGEEGLEEAIDIDVGDEDEDKFIDIRTDAEKAEDEEVEEADPRDEFGAAVIDADETGRNVAYNAFKKIETSIIDAYELLSNPEDQELFYDYLIANLKLYFDKFETEIEPDVEEPTNQAYQDAVAGEMAAEEPAEPAVAPEVAAEEEVEFTL